EGQPGAIPCTVEVNEMMGSELHLHVVTEDGTRLIVRVPTIDLEPDQRHGLQRDSRLYITFRGKVMHFFDPESQENLLN
ncbi:MAG: TOBE domain-containing protein, partial [Oscillospiraceae bacterium]|nr:TOBE domain-containing protein [Oscillospiraceae bacterium]